MKKIILLTLVMVSLNAFAEIPEKFHISFQTCNIMRTLPNEKSQFQSGAGVGSNVYCEVSGNSASCITLYNDETQKMDDYGVTSRNGQYFLASGTGSEVWILDFANNGAASSSHHLVPTAAGIVLGAKVCNGLLLTDDELQVLKTKINT